MVKTVLPYDTDAEAGVVCSIINKPEFINMAEFLKASHFYNQELASVYWAVTELIKEGVTEIDSFNIGIKCNSNKGVKAIVDKYGGDKFIKELVENADVVARTTNEDFQLVARRVSELGFRREVYRKLKSYEGEIIDESKELMVVHNQIITGIDTAAEEYLSNQKQVLYRDKIDDILAQVEAKRLKGADGIYGYPWCNDLITKAVGGQSAGELYLVAGRRKHGKSVLMLNEAIHKAKMGLKVFMSSSELSDEKDTLRMLAILSGIPIDAIKIGNIGDYDEGKYRDALHFMKHADFHREYDSMWTPDKIIMRAKTTKHRLGGLDYVVHDYIKETKTFSSSEKANVLGAYTDALKNRLAGDMEIPVLSGVQLGRAMQIADADSIERYATLALQWKLKTREEVTEDGSESGNVKVSVLFARDGHTLKDDEDWIDLFLEQGAYANLRIHSAHKQHSNMPDFIDLD
jgi:replicative DNA helicase